MILLITYILIALVFSFLCSIAEAVLLSINSPYIASAEQQGKAYGQLLRRQKADINRPLAAILTLNTVAHTLGAAGAGAQAAVVFGSGYVGITSAILTLLILVLSEIIPKTLGAVYWRQLAPVVAYALNYLIWLLHPFVLLSLTITQRLSRDVSSIEGLNREEFMAVAELGAQEGQLTPQESHILKSLFRFRSYQVKDIMTPRTVVFMLPESLSIDAFIQQHLQSPFSRIPIYADKVDQVSGFVLKAELLRAHIQDLSETPLKTFKREIKAVFAGSSILALFEFLLDQRTHIVLVVDEYGALVGIVTLEDVLETLLGFEIVDEGDDTVDMQALARELWAKRARKMGLLSEERS